MTPDLSSQSILITGASGAFGQAFLRFLLPLNPRRLIVFSRDEAKQSAMRNEFPERGPMRYFIGDVRNLERLTLAFDGVDIVVHAAAMKRVPECEAATFEAVDTNVDGTRNVIRAALECKVSKTILLSTDKAAAPNTAYGCTKLLGERMMVYANTFGAPKGLLFACTRYGNVQASTGSVVPLFRQQRASGQSFTLTDSAMTRFWMTMPQAVELVWTAMTTMRGGEVFVPKLPAIRIADLCRAVDPQHPVTVTGIRPNEKLHECLMTVDEMRHTYDRGSHYVIEPPARTWTDSVAAIGTPIVPFAYTSDAVERMSDATLRGLLA